MLHCIAWGNTTKAFIAFNQSTVVPGRGCKCSVNEAVLCSGAVLTAGWLQWRNNDSSGSEPWQDYLIKTPSVLTPLIKHTNMFRSVRLSNGVPLNPILSWFTKVANTFKYLKVVLYLKVFSCSYFACPCFSPPSAKVSIIYLSQDTLTSLKKSTTLEEQENATVLRELQNC